MKLSFIRPLMRKFGRSILALRRPFDERWMYDQFIPIQSINRSALEYDLTHFGVDEFHAPPPMTDPELSGLRELPLHYIPVALPKPYYFTVNEAIVSGPEIVAMDNPDRVFLETYAEVTVFTEGKNHTDNRISRKRALRYGKSADYDLQSAYYFTSRLSYNYYHFIIDSCLRFVDLEQEGVIDSKSKLLFHAAPSRWQLEYLKLLGVSEDRIVIHGRQMAKVRNLVIASSRRQRFAVSKSAIESLNKRIHSNLDLKNHRTPKRFLISRSLARSRRIENEDELIAALAPHGFEIVHLEEMSVTEQVALFSNAECIIGPHGAGLTNMIFSKSPVIIELIPYDYWGWGYFIPLTHAVGGTHRAIVGTRKDCSEKGFFVDIAKVIQTLSDFYEFTPD